jgi:hypothetical protein
MKDIQHSAGVNSTGSSSDLTLYHTQMVDDNNFLYWILIRIYFSRVFLSRKHRKWIKCKRCYILTTQRVDFKIPNIKILWHTPSLCDITLLLSDAIYLTLRFDSRSILLYY